MNSTLLKQYAATEIKYKALEAERNELKSQIMEEMKSEKLAKVESKFGKFTIASRPVYTYSDKVAALIDKVKVAKVKEEQKGIAISTPTEYVLFTANKD